MRELKIKNALIVGAHFDDAELGVGGTAAKLVESGVNVYKMTLTDNVTNYKEAGVVVNYESSREQSAKACKILGVNEITDFIPARCTELEYSTDMMKMIEHHIYELDIDTIFMHFNTDMNTDHVMASKLCLTAGRHVRNILQYQSNGYVLENVYYPTFFVDISNQIEKKKQALACYGEEHNRFGALFETAVARNQVWGFSNKVKYAEGFNIIKLLV